MQESIYNILMSWILYRMYPHAHHSRFNHICKQVTKVISLWRNWYFLKLPKYPFCFTPSVESRYLRHPAYVLWERMYETIIINLQFTMIRFTLIFVSRSVDKYHLISYSVSAPVRLCHNSKYVYSAGCQPIRRAHLSLLRSFVIYAGS